MKQKKENINEKLFKEMKVKMTLAALRSFSRKRKRKKKEMKEKRKKNGD